MASILEEKRRLLSRDLGLEVVEDVESADHLGGLSSFKTWLDERAQAFAPEAAGFGLPAPRGVLLVGVQGCGKSLAAKVAAAQLGVPLVRLDLPRVLGQEGAEESLAAALEAAEAISPVALWVDEIEKGFAGSAPGQGGEARAARLLGAFSTWLQERQGSVFVVATANDVTRLPPELLRRGRFDELFFVDLPDLEARREILALHLRRRRRDPAALDLAALAGAVRRLLRGRAGAGGGGRPAPGLRALAGSWRPPTCGAWPRTWSRSSGPTRSRSRRCASGRGAGPAWPAGPARWSTCSGGRRGRETSSPGPLRSRGRVGVECRGTEPRPPDGSAPEPRGVVHLQVRMASTYQLLEKAERLELLAERLYLALSGRFGGETREVFRRLADEEAQHAARVRLLTSRYRRDRKLVVSLAADTTLLDRLLVEAEETIAAVEAGAWDGDAQAALHRAAELERRFCQAHAQSLARDGHPDLRAFFEQLAAQDKAHEALLKG